MEFHPLADAFPLMEGEAFLELTQDIGKHGQIHPVILFEGMVLDGRNRYRACRALGIEPQTREFSGDDPASFVWSENAVRRQLTPGQRAMAAAKIATVGHGGARRGEIQETVRSLESSTEGLTLSDASRMTGIGTTSLKRAKTVLRDAVPAVVKAVESGALPLAPAERVAALPTDEQEALMASTPAEDIPAAVPDPRYHADGKKNKPKPVKVTADSSVEEQMINHRRWNQKRTLTEMGYLWSSTTDALRAILFEGIDPTLDTKDRIRWSNDMRETASALIMVAKKLKEIDV